MSGSAENVIVRGSSADEIDKSIDVCTLVMPDDPEKMFDESAIIPQFFLSIPCGDFASFVGQFIESAVAVMCHAFRARDAIATL